ncbi:MAG: extracellular solute-binding protein, partial [Chloroflexi bacterium]|nr:extracellular solute-binding protein [Chloroflexota bacterium]
MKKNLLVKLMSILVIASFVLAACSAPAAEEAPAAEATEAPATEEAMTEAPAEETAEEVTIRWRTRPDNQEEIDVYSQISTELDAELNGITLTYEPGGSEGANYQDQLRAEVAAGTAPDVFWIPGTDVADFGSRGL